MINGTNWPLFRSLSGRCAGGRGGALHFSKAQECLIDRLDIAQELRGGCEQTIRVPPIGITTLARANCSLERRLGDADQRWNRFLAHAPLLPMHTINLFRLLSRARSLRVFVTIPMARSWRVAFGAGARLIQLPHLGPG